MYRWIRKQLIQEDGRTRLETEILLRGRREVDGPPEGARLYDKLDLEGQLQDLSQGERCARHLARVEAGLHSLLLTAHGVL
jgi:glutamyl-tRNA reductase